jgi:hypothetical protein
LVGLCIFRKLTIVALDETGRPSFKLLQACGELIAGRYRVSCESGHLHLPYFELEFSISVNQLKIGTIRGDEPGSVRSGRERNENVKMQVAELPRHESSIRVNFSEYLARVQPIFFCRRQDGMVSFQRSQEFDLRRLRGTTPQFGQNYRRGPDEASD